MLEIEILYKNSELIYTRNQLITERLQLQLFLKGNCMLHITCIYEIANKKSIKFWNYQQNDMYETYFHHYIKMFDFINIKILKQIVYQRN